jgi:hypothetical protein
MFRTKLIWRPFKDKYYKILPENKRTYIPYKGMREYLVPGPWLSAWICMHYPNNTLKQKMESKIYYHKYHMYNGRHKNLA